MTRSKRNRNAFDVRPASSEYATDRYRSSRSALRFEDTRLIVDQQSAAKTYTGECKEDLGICLQPVNAFFPARVRELGVMGVFQEQRFLIMGSEKHQPGSAAALDQTAETVTITGKLIKKGGVQAIYVQEIK